MHVAKDYLEGQRETIAGIEKKHPDIIMRNPKASLYWYVMCTLTQWKRHHEQKYEMESKLNEKDVKMIMDHGTKDKDLGLLVPHVQDWAQVKKEASSIDELEKAKKDVESTYV